MRRAKVISVLFVFIAASFICTSPSFGDALTIDSEGIVSIGDGNTGQLYFPFTQIDSAFWDAPISTITNISQGTVFSEILLWGNVICLLDDQNVYLTVDPNQNKVKIDMLDLEVDGNITSSGTISCNKLDANIIDPPCVLYDYETRESIIKRIKDGIPPDKLSGAVMFFNGSSSQMEIFIPSKGEFRSISGKMLTSVKPIADTFEVEDKYYLDRKTGELKITKVRKPSPKYQVKSGYALDSKTGKFFRLNKNDKGIEVDRTEVPKEEAVGITVRR